MQAQKEAPPDMQCRDKFLIQSVIAPNGATNKDVTQELVGYLCYRVIVYKMFWSLCLLFLIPFFFFFSSAV